MSVLNDLRLWERRPEAWRELSRGDALYGALAQAVTEHGLDEARRLVEVCQATRPQPPDHWTITCAMLACAEIAALGDRSPDRLPELSRRFGPGLAAPGEPAGEASPRARDWPRAVRAWLSSLPWQPPLSAAWAWDAVAGFAGRPRSVACAERLAVLLVAEGRGVSARLTVERLADEGAGTLYPDPATMAFVRRDRAFCQAEADGVACVRGMGWWAEGPRPDVRWRIARPDGRPLTALEGGSAGGAFALALARLFAAP